VNAIAAKLGRIGLGWFRLNRHVGPQMRVWVNSRTARDNITDCELMAQRNRANGFLDSDFFETYSLSFVI